MTALNITEAATGQTPMVLHGRRWGGRQRRLLSALTMAIIRWVALTRGTDAVDRINILSQFANIHVR